MTESVININSVNKYGKKALFWGNQIRQIKKGGLPILIQKIYTLLFKTFCLFCALPVVVVLRILRPFIVIRFGNLDISRIGGIYYADWYLSERSAGLHGNRYFDIFYFTTIDGTICNRQWFKMWQRVLRVFPFGSFANMVDKIQRRILKGGHHVVPLSHILTRKDEPVDKYNEKITCILANRKPHIVFTLEEERMGAKGLRELGVPENELFVCFHARDSAYLNSVYPGTTWDYHDYRDSNIDNYISAAQELAQRGYFAIRMGAVVNKKLDINNSAIIDYATNGKRTDFLDIFLGSKCKFFICSDSGIAIVPEMFRRPAVYTNWTPIKRISPWVFNGLFICKKFYSRKEDRLLTFGEIINSPLGDVGTKDIFVQEEIELLENTPEEISAAAIEMDERLNGTWKTTQEDEALQQRFWALFGRGKLKSSEVRIGAEFLRQNQKFLN